MNYVKFFFFFCFCHNQGSYTLTPYTFEIIAIIEVMQGLMIGIVNKWHGRRMTRLKQSIIMSIDLSRHALSQEKDRPLSSLACIYLLFAPPNLRMEQTFIKNFHNCIFLGIWTRALNALHGSSPLLGFYGPRTKLKSRVRIYIKDRYRA